jgi:hypothetical protein
VSDLRIYNYFSKIMILSLSLAVRFASSTSSLKPSSLSSTTLIYESILITSVPWAATLKLLATASCLNFSKAVMLVCNFLLMSSLTCRNLSMRRSLKLSMTFYTFSRSLLLSIKKRFMVFICSSILLACEVIAST